MRGRRRPSRGELLGRVRCLPRGRGAALPHIASCSAFTTNTTLHHTTLHYVASPATNHKVRHFLGLQRRAERILVPPKALGATKSTSSAEDRRLGPPRNEFLGMTCRRGAPGGHAQGPGPPPVMLESRHSYLPDTRKCLRCTHYDTYRLVGL